jgi:hypothetical protein
MAAATLLVSCSAVKSTTASFKESTSAAFSKVASKAKLPDLAETPVARLLPAGGLKVVEVREKDLKELPSGQEKALAFRNERRNGFWLFGGPVDFQEPALPDAGTEADGSLLPPKLP